MCVCRRDKKRKTAAPPPLSLIRAAPSNLYLSHQRYYLHRRFIESVCNKLGDAFPYGQPEIPGRPYVRPLVGNPLAAHRLIRLFIVNVGRASRAPPDIYSLQSTRCFYFNILSLPLTYAKKETAVSTKRRRHGGTERRSLKAKTRVKQTG